MTTVQQLIEKLQTYPPDAHVCLNDPDEFGGYTGVKLDEVDIIDLTICINGFYWSFNAAHEETLVKAVII